MKNHEKSPFIVVKPPFSYGFIVESPWNHHEKSPFHSSSQLRSSPRSSTSPPERRRMSSHALRPPHNMTRRAPRNVTRRPQPRLNETTKERIFFGFGMALEMGYDIKKNFWVCLKMLG